MSATATVEDCARLCCGDWSCEAFAFVEPKAAPSPAAKTLTGDWWDLDSLRGPSKITLVQGDNGQLSATSLQPSKSYWRGAKGEVSLGSPQTGFLVFDGDAQNNRTFRAHGDTLFLTRVSFDPANFSQNFSRVPGGFGPGGNCTADRPCCIFKDDVDPLVAGVKGTQTGVRAKLPAKAAPYPPSPLLSASLDPHFRVGINGDEFPITWAGDGNQYTGAGDNHQANGASSPLSFFRVRGGPEDMGCDNPPTKHNQPAPTCQNITMMGDPVPVKGPVASKVCPQWREGIPNLKSSGTLAIDGVIYWAVSCFNYGDDKVFNRQRYGPAWIITSTDGGATFNLTATPADMFPGRLAAPRFVQYGRGYAGAPSDWVYVYFPGTTDGAAFFENNDEILLARVDKTRILDRQAYQFFNGVQLDGTVTWTSDSTIAEPVWSFPLMTSVQQANYHPFFKRYMFANWAWISYDGHPRPDHTGDERNGRTGHQRTQLTLVEAEQPWGPFHVFFKDDDWSGWDGSSGGYTPVFPPAWIKSETEMWMVFTQCCGNPRPPLNHYNFNAQRIATKRLKNGTE